jgi:hypothetical protein
LFGFLARRRQPPLSGGFMRLGKLDGDGPAVGRIVRQQRFDIQGVRRAGVMEINIPPLRFRSG